MERVSISQLKDQISAYLKKVQAGESVLITDRDKPVARLEQVDRGLDDDDRYRRLVAAGVVRPAKRPFDASLIKPVDLGRDARILEALLEERREGR